LVCFGITYAKLIRQQELIIGESPRQKSRRQEEGVQDGEHAL
jgi:hypothetical protein